MYDPLPGIYLVIYNFREEKHQVYLAYYYMPWTYPKAWNTDSPKYFWSKGVNVQKLYWAFSLWFPIYKGLYYRPSIYIIKYLVELLMDVVGDFSIRLFFSSRVK